MKITEIKNNPNNPRIIKDEKFKRLCKSIEEFPKMMKLRPIVIDNDNVILGGNMRFKALSYLGYKEIPEEWIKRAEELTDEEKQRFIISDNAGFGEWDFDMLEEWDENDLEDWGVDLPMFDLFDENEMILDKPESENNKEKKENLCKCPSCGYQFEK